MRVEEFEAVLRRVAEAQPPVADRRTLVVARVRRRRVAVTMATVAFLGLVAASVGVATRDGSQPTTVHAGRDASPSTSAPPAGEWVSVAPAPLSPRSGAVSVWTGQEFLVVGGFVQAGGFQVRMKSEAAAYDPVARRWRLLPPAPITVSDDAATAWTGTELVVWSGVDGRNEGAAYAPSTNRWRRIARSPLQGRWGAFTTWTGSELLVWGGAGQREGFPEPVILGDGAAYDPVRDAWRRLPSAPRPRGAGGVSVWTGTAWMLGGGENGTDGGPDYGFLSYEPASNAWSRPGDPALPLNFLRAGAWVDGSLLVWAHDLRNGAQWRPGTGTWEAVPAPPPAVTSDGGNPRVVEDARERVVFLNPKRTQWRAGRYDPRARSWTEIDAPAVPPRLNPTVAAGGGFVLVWGGFDDEGHRSDGVLLVDPDG